jgi:hypothetical protein
MWSFFPCSRESPDKKTFEKNTNAFLSGFYSVYIIGELRMERG